MLRKVPFVPGEIYHVFNRGVNKRTIFTHESDYRRMQLLLFLGNSGTPVHLSNLLSTKQYQGESLIEIFDFADLGNPLVNVLAYCLMPNHFHIILREVEEHGTTLFMRKISTGYSMYFNKKRERSGVLIEKPFRAVHINKDSYLQHIFAYVHLNPIDLYQSGWQEKGIQDKEEAIKFLDTYKYSSYHDYFLEGRPERAILTIDDSVPWREDFKSPETLFSFYEYEK
jgi:putative transposase